MGNPTQLWRDTRGANLVEYVILVGVIALIALAGFKSFGTSVKNKVKYQQERVESIGSTKSDSK